MSLPEQSSVGGSGVGVTSVREDVVVGVTEAVVTAMVDVGVGEGEGEGLGAAKLG